MPQTAELLLRHLQRLPLQHSEAKGILPSEALGPCVPRKGALLGPNQHTWDGTAHLPSSCLLSLRYTCGCWHLLLLCWVCVTMSLCVSCSGLNPWCWILQRGKPPCASHLVWQTIKKSLSDKSIMEYKSEHYMAVFTHGLCRSCELSHTVTAPCLTQHLCQLGEIFLKGYFVSNLSDLNLTAVPRHTSGLSVLELVSWTALHWWLDIYQQTNKKM